MDCTPGGFNNVTGKTFEPRVHATALFVVFESEWIMVADSQDVYDGQKETNVLKAVPASCNEGKLINWITMKTFLKAYLNRVNGLLSVHACQSCNREFIT